MSCWVAPKIAADFWGLPLVDILSLIATGGLRSQEDGGFRFVRLPSLANVGQRLPVHERPPTFNTITNESHLENARGEEAVTPAERDELIEPSSEESEMGPPPDEDPNDNRIAGWREGRKRASALRRGPGRPAPQKAIGF